MIECTEFQCTGVFKETEGLFYTEISNSVLGISNNVDLVSGKYEGGLKLWECSIDLLKYLKSLPSLPGKVLELGCGHGLPGIYCALQNSEVVFQDYNEEVIRYVTANNFVKNLGENKARYFYGPWGDMAGIGKFDLVLTSETIYNPDNYFSLLTAIQTSQASECLVACKNYYFGVGGGLESFLQAAGSFGFASEIVVRIEETASTRFIVKLTNREKF